MNLIQALEHACARLRLEADRHADEFLKSGRPGDLELAGTNLRAAAVLGDMLPLDSPYVTDATKVSDSSSREAA